MITIKRKPIRIVPVESKRADMIIVKGRTEHDRQKVKVFPGMYCVYLHRVDGKVIYIGAGTSYRPFDTMTRTETWSKLTSNGYEIEIFGWYEKKDEAFQTEKQLIELFSPEANRNLKKSDGTSIDQIYIDTP